MRFMSHIQRSPDAGNGGGAGTADAAGAEADSPKAENAEKPDKPERTFSQAELDAIIADRLKRQEDAIQKKAAKDKAAAEEAQLAEANKWQELADKRAADLSERDKRIAELEQAQATAEKYGAALTTYVEKLSANLPEEIGALLAGMDLADRLAWLTANAEKFAKAPEEGDGKGDGKQKRPLPETPAPRGGEKLTPEERRRQAARTW